MVLHAWACSYPHVITILFFHPLFHPLYWKKKKKEWINQCLPLRFALLCSSNQVKMYPTGHLVESLCFQPFPYQYLHGLRSHEFREYRAFNTKATTASPQLTFWRGSTPTIMSISPTNQISRHIMVTMPR